MRRPISNKARGRRNRRRYAKVGKCQRCGRHPPAVGKRNCETCALQISAFKYLGSSKRWVELRDLLAQQDNRCAYSGRPLELGLNASVEHIIPRSKGDTKDITNLKFIDRTINTAKSDQSLHEFLMMCKEVLTHFGWEVRKDDSR